MTRTTSRTIRVHRTELSTDREMLVPYAETMVALVALVALLAASWVVSAPDEAATLPVREPGTGTATAPAVYAVNRTPNATTDVTWSDPLDAPAATAVTVVAPTTS
jgi:hypothetical protein